MGRWRGDDAFFDLPSVELWFSLKLLVIDQCPCRTWFFNGDGVFMQWFPLILLAFVSPLKAEVFKCSANDGRITYQDVPCNQGDRQKLLGIEILDAKREARAIERLSEIENDYWAMKDRKAKEQADAMDLMRKQLELQNLTANLRYLQSIPPQSYETPPRYWGYSAPVFSRHVPTVYPVHDGFNPPINNAMNPPLSNPYGMVGRHRR